MIRSIACGVVLALGLLLGQNPSSPFTTSVNGGVLPSITSSCTNPVAGPVSSFGCTVTANAGDVIVLLGVPATSCTTGIASVVDSGGSTATLIGDNGVVSCAWVFSSASAGSHTITVTPTSPVSFPAVGVVAVSFINATTPLDGTVLFNSASGTTTSFSVGPITTTLNHDMLIGWEEVGNFGSVLTFNPPIFTMLTANCPWCPYGTTAAYLFAPAPGSYTMSGTVSPSSPNGSNSILLALRSQ